MKFAIVDFRIKQEEEFKLIELGFKVIKCPPSEKLYDAVCGHPDMSIHILDNNKIIVHKDMPHDFIKQISSIGFEVIYSMNSLQNSYPEDIILNAVETDSYFMHKLKCTDYNLLKHIKNKKLINVNQGYTKCSTLVVSPNAFITSDKGIYSALTKIGCDVLLLPPGDILLPGLNYGFIGGCCGLLDSSTLAFYGSLEKYIYGKEVLNFLNKHKVNPIYLGNGKLIDRGSILVLHI